MNSLPALIGRASAFHQRINPEAWKVNGVDCNGVSNGLGRSVDPMTGTLAEVITGTLVIARSLLDFKPLEGMAVYDVKNDQTYKVAAVGFDPANWKLTLEGNRNKTARPVPHG